MKNPNLSLFFLIIMFFYPLQLDAQNNWTYAEEINQAEKFVVNGNKNKALEKYINAFQLNDTPFAKDIDNALNCAVDTKNFKKAYELSEMLFKVGCSLDYFRNQESLTSLINSSGWLKVIKSYPSIKEEFDKSINQALRSKIEELFARDQYWRAKDPSYSILRDSTFKEDSLIMNELHNIIEEFGYPNEYKIGLFFDNDTTIANSPIQIILLHNYTASENYKVGRNWTEFLLKLTKEGSIPPHSFAYLNDRSGDFRISKTGFGCSSLVWKFNEKYYTESRSLESIQKIDSLRFKYGLEKFKDSVSKAVFQLKNDSRFNFFPESFISTIGLPEDMIEDFFVQKKE